MLKQRVITALIIMASLLLCLFYLPAEFFNYLILVVFAIAGWEWANLSGFELPWQRISYGFAITLVTFYIINTTGLTKPFYHSLFNHHVRDVLHVGVLWWTVALLWVTSYPASARLWGARFMRLIIGFLVLVPAAIGLIYLVGLNNGPWYFLYLVLVVAAADTGAYFAGKAFGKHKLLVNVSPGKTWQGFFGGLASSALFCVVVFSIFELGRLSLTQWLVVTVFAALASVLGDLLESMIKRHRGIKDSSQLLPGHGGVLDRIDGICAAAPVFALLNIVL